MDKKESEPFSNDGKELFADREPRIKKGLTPGRVVNGLLALNYFLIFLTGLIVAGTFGFLNNTLWKKYPDSSPNNRTCVIFSKCVEVEGTDICSFQYNSSGGCQFISAGFGIVAFIALVYMIICIVRIVLSTNIWWSVIADIVVNSSALVGVFVLGLTLSIGFAITCGQANKHYGSSGVKNCSARAIPDSNGYHFYGKTNTSQGAAWFCFLFIFISLVAFIVRSCILCRRRKAGTATDNDVLTAQDKAV